MRGVIIGFAFALLACAEDGPRSDYENNTFYFGQGVPPRHGKKVNLDFFNKECSKAGRNDTSGSEFECHYSD